MFALITRPALAARVRRPRCGCCSAPTATTCAPRRNAGSGRRSPRPPPHCPAATRGRGGRGRAARRAATSSAPAGSRSRCAAAAAEPRGTPTTAPARTTTAGRRCPARSITRSMAVGGDVGRRADRLAVRADPAGGPRRGWRSPRTATRSAGALHDAAAHERLAELDAQVAHDARARPAHRPGQPGRPARRGRRAAARGSTATGRSPCCCSTSTTSARSTAPSGTGAGDEVLRLVAERLTDLARERRAGGPPRRRRVRAAAADRRGARPTRPHAAAARRPARCPTRVRRARELVEQLGAADGGGRRPAGRRGRGRCRGGRGRPRRPGRADPPGRASPSTRPRSCRSASPPTTAARTPAAPTTWRCSPSCRTRCAPTTRSCCTCSPRSTWSPRAPTGVEALIRWQHPRRGPARRPNDFIRTVEHSELLSPFTRLVLDLALAAAADWARRRHRPAGLGKRVGPQPARPDVPGPGRRRAAPAPDAGRPGWSWRSPSRWRSASRTIVDEVLAALRDTGVQLSLDDFGTGYSLAVLRHPGRRSTSSRSTARSWTT